MCNYNPRFWQKGIHSETNFETRITSSFPQWSGQLDALSIHGLLPLCSNKAKKIICLNFVFPDAQSSNLSTPLHTDMHTDTDDRSMRPKDSVKGHRTGQPQSGSLLEYSRVRQVYRLLSTLPHLFLKQMQMLTVSYSGQAMTVIEKTRNLEPSTAAGHYALHHSDNVHWRGGPTTTSINTWKKFNDSCYPKPPAAKYNLHASCTTSKILLSFPQTDLFADHFKDSSARLHTFKPLLLFSWYCLSYLISHFP